MALKIEPQEIRFRGTFMEPMTTTLTLRNTTNKRLAYKVLTTSQDYYSVPDYKGFIEPRGAKVIKAQLMAIGDPAAVVGLSKFNHDNQKFYIKAAPTNDDGKNPENVNKILSETPKDKLFEMNLPVIFEKEHRRTEPALTVPSTGTYPFSNPWVQESRVDGARILDGNLGKPQQQPKVEQVPTDSGFYSDNAKPSSPPIHSSRKYSTFPQPECSATEELKELLNNQTFLLIMFSLLVAIVVLNNILS